MLSLKPGVSALGIRPELLLGIMVADSLYRRHGWDLTLTSLTDGQHSRTSLHNAGCAVDLRIWPIPEGKRAAVVAELNEALGPDYDVVLEKTHIHLEWQPKRG